jgi:hypothetical protein
MTLQRLSRARRPTVNPPRMPPASTHTSWYVRIIRVSYILCRKKGTSKKLQPAKRISLRLRHEIHCAQCTMGSASSDLNIAFPSLEAAHTSPFGELPAFQNTPIARQKWTKFYLGNFLYGLLVSLQCRQNCGRECPP